MPLRTAESAPNPALPADPTGLAANKAPARADDDRPDGELPENEDVLLAASPEDDQLAEQALGVQNGPNSAQPSPRERVSNGMATVAIHSVAHPSGMAASTYAGLQPAFVADYSKLDDAEIMLRVKDGDFAGYEYLVQKYRRAMVSFLYRMTRNQAIGEELAQEVFLRVYRSRATYRAEARFTTWLYRIATNLGVNYARDNKLESAASNVYLDAVDAETGTRPDVADSTPNVEQDIVRDERMAAIRACVEALPERQRMAVIMHKYQDLDYREIGRVLKLSESATKSLLFRAYQTLRESLKDFV
jgi:RNA polymerase sigma-70 factor (ECF subfamily)